MGLARALVAGCDVWLNTPERPREASGTSGMKAAMNGVLNLSVLDGWWDEAPHDEAGFVVGEAKDHGSDDEIVRALYDALEKRVLPMFFDRDAAGLPQRWIDRMIVVGLEAGQRVLVGPHGLRVPRECYVPGAFHRRALKDADREPLKRLVAWKERVRAAWPGVRFESVRDSSRIPRRSRPRRRSTCWRGSTSVRSSRPKSPSSSSRGRSRRTARSSPERRCGSRPAAREGETGVFRLTHRKPAGARTSATRCASARRIPTSRIPTRWD